MRDEFLWVEKYRPKKVEDCILPDDLKNTFQSFVDQGEVPNLILAGGPGVGKTTVAKAMLEELGCDVLLINASLHGNIDTIRTDVTKFASTVSFNDKRKYVIFDEADYMNANSTQPSLRGFIEEFSKNCGFIFTCNLKDRIIDAIHSRCSVVEFKIKTDDKPKLAVKFMKRMISILDEEGVEYEKPVLAELITKHIPDWRRVINECQNYAATGKIDVGILTNFSDKSFLDLLNSLKGKKFNDMRKWVSLNFDGDINHINQKMYNALDEHVENSSIPMAIVTMNEYAYKSAFVVDQEINLVAMLSEIMVDCEWKK